MTFSSGLTSITGNVTAVTSGTSTPLGQTSNVTAQAVHCGMVYYQNGTNYYQIATPDSTHDIYLLGWIIEQTTAAADTFVIFDAASGNAPSLSANTAYVDTTAWIFGETSISTIHNTSIMLPVPYKLTNGLRAQIGSTGTGYAQLFYLTVTHT